MITSEVLTFRQDLQGFFRHDKLFVLVLTQLLRMDDRNISTFTKRCHKIIRKTTIEIVLNLKMIISYPVLQLYKTVCYTLLQIRTLSNSFYIKTYRLDVNATKTIVKLLSVQ